jgi:hypothetical protein
MPAGKPERGSYSSAGSAAGRGYPKSSQRSSYDSSQGIQARLVKQRNSQQNKAQSDYFDRAAKNQARYSFDETMRMSKLPKPKPPKTPRTPMSKTTKRVAKIASGTAAMGTAIGIAGTGISKIGSSKNTKSSFAKTTTTIKSGKYAGKRVPKGNG